MTIKYRSFTFPGDNNLPPYFQCILIRSNANLYVPSDVFENGCNRKIASLTGIERISLNFGIRINKGSTPNRVGRL